LSKETSITSRLNKASGRNSARDSYCFDSSRLGYNSNRKNSDNFETPGNDNFPSARASLPANYSRTFIKDESDPF